MTDGSPGRGPTQDGAVVPHTLLERGLGDAVVADRITTGETLVALTEGALNLLSKAQALLATGGTEERERALALVVRALDRLPDPSDTTGLGDVHDHVVRVHEFADDLRRAATQRTDLPS